jgi:hypothetical protein
LFCNSLFRHPSEENVLVSIKNGLRDNPGVADRKNFYSSFQKWVIEKYGGETISEENWRSIIEEDSLISYTCSSSTSPDAVCDNADDTNDQCEDELGEECTIEATQQTDLVYNFVN